MQLKTYIQENQIWQQSMQKRKPITKNLSENFTKSRLMENLLTQMKYVMRKMTKFYKAVNEYKSAPDETVKRISPAK